MPRTHAYTAVLGIVAFATRSEMPLGRRGDARRHELRAPTRGLTQSVHIVREIMSTLRKILG